MHLDQRDLGPKTTLWEVCWVATASELGETTLRHVGTGHEDRYVLVQAFECLSTRLSEEGGGYLPFMHHPSVGGKRVKVFDPRITEYTFSYGSRQ